MPAPDERIDLAHSGTFVEIDRKHIQGAAFRRRAGLVSLLGCRQLALAFARHLGNSVRNIIHDIKAGDVLFVQEVDHMGFLLREYCDQHIGAGDLFLAGTLDVQDGALDHPLKSQCGLGVNFAPGGQLGDVFFQEFVEISFQNLDIGATGAQHTRRRGVVEQRRHEVFHRDVFVVHVAGCLKRRIQRILQFLR